MNPTRDNIKNINKEYYKSTMIYGTFKSGSENSEIQTKYLWPWIQNVADPRWNGRIGKVFELT